jgi:hypothetical protein
MAWVTLMAAALAGTRLRTAPVGAQSALASLILRTSWGRPRENCYPLVIDGDAEMQEGETPWLGPRRCGPRPSKHQSSWGTWIPSEVKPPWKGVGRKDKEGVGKSRLDSCHLPPLSYPSPRHTLTLP